MASLYPPTPRMTRHARLRCQEMGISTKLAKRVARAPDLVRSPGPGHGVNERIMTADAVPAIAVVVTVDDDPVVITVLWRTQETYSRAVQARV